MTVLITGGTGFVGLNLAEALLTRGQNVIIAALDAPLLAAQRLFAKLPGHLVLENLDVRDGTSMAMILRRHTVEWLFPFAAITSGASRDKDDPESVFAVNLMGLIAQLRAARQAGVRRVVIPSSSGVYGESFYQQRLLDEATPCVPVGLYGISKYAAERTALRLGELWGLDVVAARIGAVFGPWEHDTGLRDTLSPFWQALRLARTGQAAVVPAEIAPYRFVYARDVATALLHLATLPDPPHRVFNICSGVELKTALAMWCDMLVERFPGFTWRSSGDPNALTVRPTDTRPRGRMDTARLVATGWKPQFPPQDAFADYRKWIEAGSDLERDQPTTNGGVEWT